MDDAIARYADASERNDIEALMSACAPDVELVSPISGRMVFRGEDDVRHLRPWLALTLFALVLGPQVGRRPGMVWRALRAA